MSEFQAFDSFEDMVAAMAEAEEAANQRLSPEQIEIRDDTEHVRYWVRPYPAAGVLIFGRAYSAPELAQMEPAAASHLAEMRQRGYLFSMAYSMLEPDGEPGDTHVANLMPISEAAFKEAQTSGWRAVDVPAADLALMGEAAAYQGGWTPTLVAELRALDRTHEAGA